MTEKTKQIFADGAKLREKLGIYLQTPEKVEIYAQAAEKMFAKTGGTSIGFVPTWSWWEFFCGGLFFLYRKLYLFGIVCIILGLILSIIIGVVSALIAKYTVIKDFEKKLDLDNDLALATGVNKWAIYVPIALVVIVILAEIIGGADESKAPKIRSEFEGWAYGVAVYAISQDDNTIIDGVTVSGRNGRCEKQTILTPAFVLGANDFTSLPNLFANTQSLIAHKDMNSCLKAVMTMQGKKNITDADIRAFKKTKGAQACTNELAAQHIFDGQELPFGNEKMIYFIKTSECLPKNGVWEIELETNFGTYEYEL